MKNHFASLVIMAVAGCCSVSATSYAGSYTFNYSDSLGDIGVLQLVTGPSGYTDGSELVTAGTLTLTSSTDSNASIGTHSLVPGGPGITSGAGGVFYYDNLLYPQQNAAGGHKASSGPVTDPSYLDAGGLLFAGGGNYFNIYAVNLASSYQLDAVKGSGGGFAGTGGTLTAVPEPSTCLMTVVGVGIVGLMNWRKRRVAHATA